MTKSWPLVRRLHRSSSVRMITDRHTIWNGGWDVFPRSRYRYHRSGFGPVCDGNVSVLLYVPDVWIGRTFEFCRFSVGVWMSVTPANLIFGCLLLTLCANTGCSCNCHFLELTTAAGLCWGNNEHIRDDHFGSLVMVSFGRLHFRESASAKASLERKDVLPLLTACP